MNKVLTHVRNFFKNLFSAKGDVGTKRVTGIWLVLLFTAEVIVHLKSKVNIQVEVLYVTAGLIGACYGFNTWITLKELTTKSQVASDIAKNDTSDPAASIAAEVITTAKPIKEDEEESVG